MSSKPKAPKPTAQEIELQRSQRKELDTLTRDRNATLKTLKRNLGGRRGLLGSGSESGLRSGASGGRGGNAGAGGGGGSSGGLVRPVRPVAGGILGSGGGSYRPPRRTTAV